MTLLHVHYSNDNDAMTYLAPRDMIIINIIVIALSFQVSRGAHPPKPIMYIAYSPYIHQI